MTEGEGLSLCPAQILRCLETGHGWRVRTFDSLSSTSDLVMEAARRGEAQGLAVAAACQTRGRGRKDRLFFSPPTGMYLSVLLRPQVLDPVHLTLGGGLAAAAAVEELCGKRAGIKWVNDILLRGRKVGGILCERAGEAAVLGIGINLLPPPAGWPPNICCRAGSVFDCVPPGEALREKLIALVLNQLRRVQALSAGEILREYRAACVLLGREVTLPDRGSLRAMAVDIDDCGGLVVRHMDGRVEVLRAGEVRCKLAE